MYKEIRWVRFHWICINLLSPKWLFFDFLYLRNGQKGFEPLFGFWSGSSKQIKLWDKMILSDSFVVFFSSKNSVEYGEIIAKGVFPGWKFISDLHNNACVQLLYEFCCYIKQIMIERSNEFGGLCFRHSLL